MSIPITPSFETSTGVAAARAKVTSRRSVETRSAAFSCGIEGCRRRTPDQVAVTERSAASLRCLRSCRRGFTFHGSSASRASTVVAVGRCSKT